MDISVGTFTHTPLFTVADSQRSGSEFSAAILRISSSKTRGGRDLKRIHHVIGAANTKPGAQS